MIWDKFLKCIGFGEKKKKNKKKKNFLHTFRFCSKLRKIVFKKLSKMKRKIACLSGEQGFFVSCGFDSRGVDCGL